MLLQVNDTFKAQAANMLELDMGIANVTAALKARGMWDDTLVVLVSDNGGPLDHTTNAPLRGGKHTFWEGGVRVVSFVSGGANALPAARRGTVYRGMMHSSDWYRTFVEGVAGGSPIDPNGTNTTGPTPPDGFNMWPVLQSPAAGEAPASPRTEVIHGVRNRFFNDSSTGYALRVGAYKLLVGDPGDARTLAWPAPSDGAPAFGTSGGVVSPHNRCRAGPKAYPGVPKPKAKRCHKTPCLFNVVADPGETTDLAPNASYAHIVAQLTARLEAAGMTGPDTALAYPYDARTQAKHENASCLRGLQNGTMQPFDAVPQ